MRNFTHIYLNIIQKHDYVKMLNNMMVGLLYGCLSDYVIHYFTVWYMAIQNTLYVGLWDLPNLQKLK